MLEQIADTKTLLIIALTAIAIVIILALSFVLYNANKELKDPETVSIFFNILNSTTSNKPTNKEELKNAIRNLPSPPQAQLHTFEKIHTPKDTSFSNIFKDTATDQNIFVRLFASYLAWMSEATEQLTASVIFRTTTEVTAKTITDFYRANLTDNNWQPCPIGYGVQFRSSSQACFDNKDIGRIEIHARNLCAQDTKEPCLTPTAKGKEYLLYVTVQEG